MSLVARKGVAWIALLLLGAACVIEAGAWWRQRERAVFFRSKMEEFRLLADLQHIFPIGMDDSSVLETLGPEARSAWVRRDHGGDVSVRFPLPVAPMRDYRGYTFRFARGRLVGISPVGPDGAGVDIALGPELRRRLDRVGGE